MEPSAYTNTRSKAAKPAAFAPTDMKPAMGVGAPSYTSGVHMWNGTTATLKPRPTRMSAAPNNNMGEEPPAVTFAAICARSVVPSAPYVIAMPNSRKPEANAPSRKYFSAASSEAVSGRAKPASTYNGIDSSSSAMKTMIRLWAAAIITMPPTLNSSST